MTQEQHDETQPIESTGAAVADAPAADSVEDHFVPRDIDNFSDDDTEAGSAIGWMLALFFFYTVIVMAWSAYWTFSSVGAE